MKLPRLPRLPRLLCLAGKAGAGKDTLADYLVREHGYVKYRFADPLKRLIADRFGLDMNQVNTGDWRNEPRSFLGQKAGDFSENYFSLRSWMQWLGTEVGRTIGGEDVWVDAMWRSYIANDSPKPMVVCDARFDNEAASFWAHGGDVLHIERPGAGAVLAHASEAGISEEFWSASVVNDGSVDEFLQRAVAALAARS